MPSIPTPTVAPDVPMTAASRVHEHGPAILWPTFLGLTMVFLGFWLSWSRFPEVWNAEREHGFMVAAMCLWLGYRDRKALFTTGAPENWGLLVLVILGMLWLVSMAISVQVAHLIIAPVMLAVWLTTVNGRSAGKAALPILGFFLLAVPVWEVLQWPLQQLTVGVNAVLFRLFRLQGVVVDNQIRTPWGTLEVAYECAGLNYLLAGVTIGSAYSLLFVQGRKLGFRIIAVAAALSIVGNWVRVFGLSVIASVTQMQSPLVRDHGWYGWVIFAVFMAGFFAIAQRLEQRDQVVEEDTVSRMTDRVQQSNGSLSWGHWGAAVAIALSAPLLLTLLRYRPMPEAVEMAIPVGVAAHTPWKHLPAAQQGAWQPGFSGSVRHSAAYWNNNQDTLRIDRYFYRSGRQEGKLVGSANRVAADSVLLGSRMVGPLDASARTVAEAAIRNGNSVTLVWYWYRVAGVTTAQPLRAKLLELLTFFSNGSPAELLAVSVRCHDSSCENARRALYNFVTGKVFPENTK